MPMHCFETEMTFSGKLKCKNKKKTHQYKNDPPVAPRTIEQKTQRKIVKIVYTSQKMRN